MPCRVIRYNALMPTAGAAETVRDRVALADRLRRGRETSRRLWRAAPLAAAACAVVAAAARWTGWSPLLPLALLAIMLAALAIYAYLSRRERAISDTAALEIDRLAGLGGELRSANWFSATGVPGNDAPWVEFHLARAADRLGATDWSQLYPPVRANRAKAATALLVIAALVLALPVGGRAGLRASGSGQGPAGKGGLTAAEADALTAELRKQIEDLLKKAERGDAPGTAGALTVAEVRDLLAKLAQAKDLQDAKDDNRAPDATAKKLGMTGKELKDLAERLKNAGEISSLAPEVKDALAEAAQKLSEMAEETEPSSPKDPNDAMGAAAAQQGDAAPGKKGDKAFDDSSIKSATDASAGGGVGVVMMASESPQGAQEAGLGLGGASAKNKGGGTMPDLGSALRKETIEAHEDDTGDKATQDLRRKTEKGTATIGYSSTAPAAFDQGRATAPPAVPENRRAAVQTYFLRKQ